MKILRILAFIDEVVGLLAALSLLDRKTGRWRGFILILFLIASVDQLSWAFHLNVNGLNNLPWNLLTLTSTTFFMWFLAQHSFVRKQRQLNSILIATFVVFCLCNLFFGQGIKLYNTYSETFGDLILIAMSCHFLFTLVHSKEYLDLFRYEDFWLASALLIYAVGNALNTSFAYFLYTFYVKTNILVGAYIQLALNLTFTLMLIIAFFFRRKNTRMSPAS